MKLGFTGTRRGMTDAQTKAFRSLVCRLDPSEFHHGACVGADADIAFIVAHYARYEGMACSVVAHPGHPAAGETNEHLSEPALMVSIRQRATTTHFVRNRNIVNATDSLVACPWQSSRPPKGTGGGTWYTVDYAEKVGKPVTVIWPDGATQFIG